MTPRQSLVLVGSGGEIARSFIDRFKNAYDAELQSWADAAKPGEIGGTLGLGRVRSRGLL